MTSYFIGSHVGGVVMCGRGFAGIMWPLFFHFLCFILVASIIELEGGASPVTTWY